MSFDSNYGYKWPVWTKIDGDMQDNGHANFRSATPFDFGNGFCLVIYHKKFTNSKQVRLAVAFAMLNPMRCWGREGCFILGAILTLCVLNFSEIVISPPWYDAGSWNPSSIKTITYLFYIVNILAADVLATQGARASAAMILTKFNRDNSVPTR